MREEKKKAYDLTGDTWHDNPYFNKLEQDERALLMEISSLNNFLTDAEIISDDDRDLDTVGIGSIFMCSFAYDDEEEEVSIFEIVQYDSLGISDGRISSTSLVAQNLIGLKINESVTFDTPGGRATYKVLKFYKSWDDAENEKQ